MSVTIAIITLVLQFASLSKQAPISAMETTPPPNCMTKGKLAKWKTCDFIPDANLSTFHTSEEYRPYIVKSLLNGDIALDDNSAKCHAVKQFQVTSKKTETCTTTCKLKDQKIDNCAWDYNELIRDIPSTEQSEHMVAIGSRNCSGQYPRRYMCVYSISLPECGDRGIQVNSRSWLDIHSNDDYLQVLENKNNMYVQHPVISGAAWPYEQLLYSTTKLTVLFWSGQDKNMGRGFKVQFNCAPRNPPILPEEDTSSGDNSLLQLD